MSFQHDKVPATKEANTLPGLDDDIAAVDTHFEQEREITGLKWLLVVSSVLSASALYALDNTVIADLQPSIVASFGEVQKMPWVSVGTLMGCLATNNVWGKVFGQVNTKWAYIVSVVIFEVGSALCGAAPNMNALIVARVLQGVGGVGIYLGVMTLLSVHTTRKERPTYISMAGIAWGLGTVCGPIIGGAFAESAVGWRWAFYINLFFAALQIPIAVLLIPSFDPRPGVPWRDLVSRVDYMGALLMAITTVTLVIAINTGGQMYRWSSAPVITCLVIFGVSLAALGIQQAKCILVSREHRIFPCQFANRPIFVNLFLQAGSAAAVSFIAIYYVPTFFQYTRGDSAIEAGIRLLPLVCLLVAASLLSGALMSAAGYYMPWFLFGAILALAGSALMHLVKVDTAAANIYGYTILIGAGCGLYQQAGFAVAQIKAKPSENADASSFVALGQLTGATVALAIANNVFLSQSVDNVQAFLPEYSKEEVRQIIAGSDRAQLRQSFSPGIRDAILRALSDAIGSNYIIAIAFAALSIVLALLLPVENIFVTRSRAQDTRATDDLAGNR